MLALSVLTPTILLVRKARVLKMYPKRNNPGPAVFHQFRAHCAHNGHVHGYSAAQSQNFVPVETRLCGRASVRENVCVPPATYQIL